MTAQGAVAGKPWLARGRKITDNIKAAFLFAVAELGSDQAAADAVGCSVSGLKRHTDANLSCFDPEFTEAWGEAKERFNATLLNAAFSRAVNGWQEPIIGGEFRDEVVAHKPMFSDRLLELLLKRFDPNYRERLQIESNKTVTHIQRLDVSSMPPEARLLVRQLLDAQEPKVIDITPTAVTIPDPTQGEPDANKVPDSRGPTHD